MAGHPDPAVRDAINFLNIRLRWKLEEIGALITSDRAMLCHVRKGDRTLRPEQRSALLNLVNHQKVKLFAASQMPIIAQGWTYICSKEARNHSIRRTEAETNLACFFDDLRETIGSGASTSATADASPLFFVFVFLSDLKGTAQAHIFRSLSSPIPTFLILADNHLDDSALRAAIETEVAGHLVEYINLGSDPAMSHHQGFVSFIRRTLGGSYGK